MCTTDMLAKTDVNGLLARASAPGGISVVRLSSSKDAAEALAFLASRPIHTVNLRGFIHDNGLDNPLNRGSFYGFRNAEGRLEGVALIGHATLIEAHTERALEALARCAQEVSSDTHMIMGERERIEEFWGYYAEDGQQKRLACRELLLELRWPVEGQQEVPELRLATLADLELILPVQAEMAEEESGVNPLTKDPAGFRRRCARRIEQGRVWVLVEDGRLIFKADVFAETPEVIYLEGIYVNALERAKGYGLRCLSQLSQTLLQQTEVLCILVNEENEAARAFYSKAGFKFISTYDTIFLQPKLGH
jgi:predicted GNAT family acetyltransferase